MDSDRRHLAFSGSNLTGTWLGAMDAADFLALDSSRATRRYWVDALLEAEQIHPKTWAEEENAWDSPQLSRWTWEGPSYTLPGEDGPCTARIEMRLNVTGQAGEWDDWVRYRPGLYDFVDIQFRLVFTRPDTTWQIKVHRFHTRVLVPRPSAVEHTRVDSFIEAEIL